MLEATQFKTFLVEGGRSGRTVFRVEQLPDDITREQMEQLLSILPIGFAQRVEGRVHGDEAANPLRVVVNSGQLMHIYPGPHRMLATVNHDMGANPDNPARKMYVDNLFDLEHPANGQIRGCIHLDPAEIGITGWPTDALEIDVYAYPEGWRPAPVAPRFAKTELRDLLALMVGSDGQLDQAKIEQHRALILYAVETHRRIYDDPERPSHAQHRERWGKSWDLVEAAGNDTVKLTQALERLR